MSPWAARDDTVFDRGSADADPPARSRPAHPAEWLSALSAIPVQAIEIDVRFLRSVSFSEAACVVLRGLLGSSLRERTCSTRAVACDGCRVASTCAYARAFGEHARHREPGQGTPLQPYWLQGMPATDVIPAGDHRTIRLLTTATAIQDLPALESSLGDALPRFGRRRSTDPPVTAVSRPITRPVALGAAPEVTSRLRIAASTPLLLTAPRRSEWSCASAPWLATLLAAGLRRLRGLARLTPGAWERIPRVAIPAALEIEVVDVARPSWSGAIHSRRQGVTYDLEGGLWIDAVLAGRDVALIGAILQVLATTGVGKKTTMGFGDLRVEPVP